MVVNDTLAYLQKRLIGRQTGLITERKFIVIWSVELLEELWRKQW